LEKIHVQGLINNINYSSDNIILIYQIEGISNGGILQVEEFIIHATL
jgi:hypothetical protein